VERRVSEPYVVPAISVDVPDIDLMRSGEEAAGVRTDPAATDQQPVDVAVRTCVEAESDSAHQAVIVPVRYGQTKWVQRTPHEVRATLKGGYPCGAPTGLIHPTPSIVAVIPPAPVVARDVREGVISHPDVATSGNIAPIAVAVRDKPVYRGPPVGRAVDVNPVTIEREIRGAKDVRRYACPGGGLVRADRQHARLLAVPGVERIFRRAVKDPGSRRQVPGVNV
jgi:hypothetical protein